MVYLKKDKLISRNSLPRLPFSGVDVDISCAVRWYDRFILSLCDIEEELLKRRVTVTYESARRWCDRFGAQFARVLRSSPVPRKIVTDQLRSYPAVKDRYRSMPHCPSRKPASRI